MTTVDIIGLSNELARRDIILVGIRSDSDKTYYICDHQRQLAVQATGDTIDTLAASNGAKKYEPHYKDFTFLQGVLDDQEIPTFYKGNLRSLTTKHGIQWREDFPMIEPQQMRLL